MLLAPGYCALINVMAFWAEVASIMVSIRFPFSVKTILYCFIDFRGVRDDTISDNVCKVIHRLAFVNRECIHP